MADRRPRIWHLRDAALCEDHTSRHRGCPQRRVGTLEQRADRRTDQQAENPQASHVWPRQCRVASCPDDAVVGRRLAPASTASSHRESFGLAAAQTPCRHVQNVLLPLLRRTQRKMPASAASCGVPPRGTCTESQSDPPPVWSSSSRSMLIDSPVLVDDRGGSTSGAARYRWVPFRMTRPRSAALTRRLARIDRARVSSKCL